MRVLVTGACGMLGTDLCRVLREHGDDPIATDVRDVRGMPAMKSVGLFEQLDITDYAGTCTVMDRVAPDVVIHCAAYTNVDQAEREPDAVYRINELGSWVIAAACAARSVPICAISTDFVFDGAKREPYVECDPTNPLGVYGASKLAGEVRVREAARRHWIVRTSWLYGVHGKSFPDTMIRAAEAGKDLRVIADQQGTPTFTGDLAEALAGIIRTPLYGTYHVANGGVTTWYDFARAALEMAGLGHVPVTPISAAEWPTATRRPAYSALRPHALELQGAALPRPWQSALADFVERRRAAHASAG